MSEAPELIDHVPHVPTPQETPPSWVPFFDGYGSDEADAGHQIAQRLTDRFATVPEGDDDEHEVLITHAYPIAWLIRHALDAPAVRWLGLSSANAAQDGVDLRARPGTVLSVLGPNGAGKTTAILATLTGLDAGIARVGGADVTREAAKVRQMIGLTGQYATLDEELTGLGNLILIGRLLDLRKPEASRRAAELLERVGLTEAASKPVATYSGGMRRRLDLAASHRHPPQEPCRRGEDRCHPRQRLWPPGRTCRSARADRAGGQRPDDV